jgi:hypothetical protein
MTALQKPSNGELTDGGIPNPLDFRVPRSVGGLFADGAVLLAANTYTQILPIAGCLQVRLRGKFTCAGTLSFAYRRPAPNFATAYSTALTPPSVNVVVVANTELQVDIQPVGEAYLEVTLAPSGNGAVTFLDVLQQ